MSGDFGSPVVQPVDPNQGINSLSALVGLQSKKLAIQQQQQNLETGQSTQASAKAKATVDTQGAKENQALAQLMADPVKNGLVDRDGNPAPGAQSIIMKVAPTTGSANFGDLVNAARTKVEFDTAKSNLTGAQQAQAGSVIGGASAGAKSPAEVKAITDAYVAQRAAIGDPAAANFQKIFDAANSVGGHASQQGTGKEAPGQEPWRQTYQNVSRALSLPAAATVGPGGVGTPQAADVSNGAVQSQGVRAPALQGGGFTPGTSQVVQPGPAVTTLPSGSLGTVGGAFGVPGTGTSASGATPSGPRTAVQDAPSPNAPRAVQDAFIAATKQANDHVDSVRTADESYGNNKAISNAVRTLAAGSSTGPGTETWNHVMGVLGTKGADNYQELGAFLDRQAATVRGQMGLPGTNAGAEDAKMIAGNTKYNTKVIQDKNDYTEALTDGLHMYRNGLDRVAGFGGQASPAAVAKFKSAWTNSFDPNVLIGENAYKRSKAEGDAFVKSLPPQEAASLLQKRKELQALSAGQLPQ